MEKSIVIVDYGAGNLRSIYKALEKVCMESGSGMQPIVSSDPRDLDCATAVVLPGVGAAGPTMMRLQERGLVEALRSFVTQSDRPFLGICLGLQLLFSHHEEGDIAGIGILPGDAKRFNGLLKVPHMGWNRLYSKPHMMFEDIGPDTYFYYVHSYYAEPEDAGLVIGTTQYGHSFCGALAQGNLWATQFHPEKSGADGLRLLHNFVLNVEAA